MRIHIADTWRPRSTRRARVGWYCGQKVMTSLKDDRERVRKKSSFSVNYK